MANALYALAKQSLLSQNPSIDLDTDTIKVFLVDGGVYTPNLVTDQFLSSVPAGARYGNTGLNTRADAITLTTKTIALGVFDADDISFTSIPTGPALEYLLIFKDDGAADASSPLIALFDTGPGFPFTPNGAPISVTWNGTSKIFSI